MNLYNGISKWLVIFALFFIFDEKSNALSSSKQVVYWSGFAFQGAESSVSKRYKYSHKLNLETDDGTPYFSRYFRDFFQANKANFTEISLVYGSADKEKDTLALALVMMEEQVLLEKLGSIHKLVIQLGFELVVLDFEGLQVICSQPIIIEYRDASALPFTNDQIKNHIHDIIIGADSQLTKVLNNKMGKVQVLGKRQGTLRINNVSVGEKAIPFLSETYRSQLDSYKQALAQQFSVLLSSQAGVATLPFAKDSANANMALVFSDGSTVQFNIPSPTFAVDLNLRGFKKVLSKKTEAESLWVYGAFLDVKVYEPEFDIIFFEKPMKYGVSKIVPASQSQVDEFPVVSEAFKGVSLEAIDQILTDKDTSKKVISKCIF